MDKRTGVMYRTVIQKKRDGDIAERNLREEIFRQMKEEEKEQRQDRYEKELEEAAEELSHLTGSKEWMQVRERAEKIVDRVENIAFMEGYRYAIAVLEETLGNMEQ